MGMSDRPVMLLDIDGVINCFLRREDTRPPYHIWPKASWKHLASTFQGSPWPILWTTDVVDFLTELHAGGQVEIRWHTTWQHEAPKLAVALGLPQWPVHPCPEFEDMPARVAARQILAGKPAWWKYPAAERVLTEEKRPLIWVDDDITYEVNRRARDAMYGLGQRLLVISPNTYTGLTPKQLGKIANFLKGDPAHDDARGALSSS